MTEVLRPQPAVYMTALPGMWLLDHSTPSWRIEDPKKGFQRIVNEDRARAISRTVLDEGRTFPNAITLATKTKELDVVGSKLTLPGKVKFLVVDGQHRLWAQKFSKVNGLYPCIIHMDRTEPQMAQLFLEINDNQRRVPSSLRWDLYRLVRNEDRSTVMTSDIVFALTTNRESPFYVVGLDVGGIDLTGEETNKVAIRQGSLAPEIRSILRRQMKKDESVEFDDYLSLFIRFFVAIRSLDPDGWGTDNSVFFKARVLRALLRVLSDMMDAETIGHLTTKRIHDRFAKIDKKTLSDVEVRKAQGSAGVRDLYMQMRSQIITD